MYACCAQLIDGGFEAAGLPYSYGFAIIALTLLVGLRNPGSGLCRHRVTECE